MKGGTWNMERDRPKPVAAHSALAIMVMHDLDFLCIQECAGYLGELGGHPDFALFPMPGNRGDGRGESALLVRRTTIHGAGWQVRATRSGWFTVRGGKTPPKWLTCCVVAGVIVVSGHTAPSVRWQGGRILGPIRRVASMRQFARRVVKFARNHPNRPLLIACDWNATPSARGRYSPHWIARKADLEVLAPKGGTHGNRVIDYALVRGLRGRAHKERQRGSDHYPVLFEVTR